MADFDEMVVTQSTSNGDYGGFIGLPAGDFEETEKIKQYLIRPTKEVKIECKLNLIDHLMPSIYTPHCFIYNCRNESEDASIYRPRLIQRLKTSLKILLDGDGQDAEGLPELAGKIFQDKETGGLTLRIDHDSAIRFVVSVRDDISLDVLGKNLHYPQHFLNPEILGPGFKITNMQNVDQGCAAFWVQLTLVESGFILMVNKAHALADGGSFAPFIQMWFHRIRELQSNTAVSSTNVYHREKMFSVNKSVPTLPHPELGPSEHGSHRKPVTYVDRQIFHISAENVQNLKESIGTYKNVRLTTNDLLGALLWRCITRARNRDADVMERGGHSRFVYAVSIRHLVTPKRTVVSLDNAVYPIIADLGIETLAKRDLPSLIEIATTIRAAVKGLTLEHLQSAFQVLEPKLPWRPLGLNIDLSLGNDLLLTITANTYSSAESLDIGCGEFQCIRHPDRKGHDGTVVILPTYGRRDIKCESGYAGGIEVYVELEKEHLDNLRADTDWLQFATFKEYGGW